MPIADHTVYITVRPAKIVDVSQHFEVQLFYIISEVNIRGSVYKHFMVDVLSQALQLHLLEMMVQPLSKIDVSTRMMCN